MIYRVSFRCYFDTDYTQHYQDIALKDVAKWINAYKFTHPNCKAITFRISFENQERSESECITA